MFLAIDKRGPKSARNSVFHCHLSPSGDKKPLETVFSIAICRRRQIAAKNSVFHCHLSPVGRQMAIETSVSSLFLDPGSSIVLTFSISAYQVCLCIIASRTLCRGFSKNPFVIDLDVPVWFRWCWSIVPFTLVRDRSQYPFFIKLDVSVWFIVSEKDQNMLIIPLILVRIFTHLWKKVL